jgi:hypothetical protein
MGGQTRSIVQRAKELGLTVDELQEFTSLLFGDRPAEAACDPPSGEVASGPSISRLPSESEIAALPERTAIVIRELEAKRAAKLTEILSSTGSLMGHEDFVSLDAETRSAIERMVQEAVERWAWEVKLVGPLITTKLERLLHEHYELTETLRAFLNDALLGDRG